MIGLVTGQELAQWMGWHRGAQQAARTWYFVRRVLQTPVRSIIPTRKGITALVAMLIVCVGMTALNGREAVTG